MWRRTGHRRRSVRRIRVAIVAITLLIVAAGVGRAQPSAPASTDVAVRMPALGEDVTEGVVTRWFKRAGAFVARDEPLLEASTDKVDVEIPSPVSGVVRRILVARDQVAEVGAVIAIIDTSRTR